LQNTIIEKDALLKIQRFFSLRSVYGPVGFFGKEFQDLYDLRLIKKGKVKGIEAYIIEAVPKPEFVLDHVWGRMWISKEDYKFFIVQTDVRLK
jgi:hypothetical protein